ncbi:hypothetical protein R1flu_010529 [Riccia fluitans]|uniref:Uncharacterized protein n=1 Tax=Riccia fluitans TaxID=41844 RepID=A0ABD1Z590_9MARC
MTHNRNQWDRNLVQWVRRPNHDDDATTSSKNTSAWEQPKKDSTDNWGGRETMQDQGACWTVPLKFEGNGLYEFRNVFDWDNSAAEEVLLQVSSGNRSKATLQDYLADCERYSARVDWQTRRSCNLPDCAEALTREENRRQRKGYNTALDNRVGRRVGSPVIIGLPEEQTGKENDITSIHLPLFVVPAPTGWDDEVKAMPTPTGWDDDVKAMPTPTGWGDEENVIPTAAQQVEDVDEQIHRSRLETSGTPVGPSASGQEQVSCAQDVMDTDSVRATTFPSNLDSYKHIVPSGWGDSSEENRYTPYVGQGNCVARDLSEDKRPGDITVRWNSSRGSGILHRDKEKLGSGGQFKCSGPEYWKLKKRENDSRYNSGPLYRRNPQKSGRPSYANNLRVNDDTNSSRGNRWDRPKTSVWQATCLQNE